MKWYDALEQDVYDRLGNCRTVKSDLVPLTQARWDFIKEKPHFVKEDALVQILELLESNSRYFDLTTDEYNDILQEVY